MHLVIGILAWNEESSIGGTIRSLAAQTLFRAIEKIGATVEVIVVPNACTDRTAEVAEAALEKRVRIHPGATARVESLTEGGKSNAWNELVHRFAPEKTDYFILMDADIELLGEDTLERMWSTLEKDAHAHIATDLPVKHVARKARLSLKERFLLGAGAMTQSAPGQLTGQLYCARAGTLRKIRIPRGLIVDDGFIKQMVCTLGFSEPADASRIVRAEGAAHVFECYTRLRDIWNHQVRQAVGHTLYTYFTAYIRANMPDRPIFGQLKALCETEPDWFARFAREEIGRRGFWVMDRSSFWVRWRRAKAARGARKLRFLALAAAATPFDAAVFYASNARLKSGRVNSIWKDTRTTTVS
ncbi:MAG: glycosyltransferase [Opitutales bacterium]|nr:glycosyltransferase [Opitutales bacterium]